MRKSLTCVLMITLLLTGCGRSKADSPEQLAALIRTEYLSLSGWSSDVELSAVYEEQVFDFKIRAEWEREGETVLTVLEPELLEGITARIRKGESLLEYDGAGVSLGVLDMNGLTPVTAIPALMACITGGYMARCSWTGEGEGKQLAVFCRDPKIGEGEGTEFFLYFEPSTHALLRAEISTGGVMCVKMTFLDFTAKVIGNGTEPNEDLGGDQSGESGT